MKARTTLTRAAWAAYGAAWFIPVHKDGVRLPEGLPGWQAFRVAFSPVWPYEGFEGVPLVGAILMTASAISNLVFAYSACLAAGRFRSGPVLRWCAIVALLINAQWLFDGGWAELRAGYYAWWASFALLAASTLRTQPRVPREPRAAEQGDEADKP